MPRLLELLRPPAHRGPLIAAGAVLVTVGLGLEEIRLRRELAPGVHLLILVPAATALLALGLQARTEGGRPPAYQSVLLVAGLAVAGRALLRLANVLGDEMTFGLPSSATFTWTALLLAGLALWPAVRKGSSVCALIGALALGVAVLAFVNWSTGANSATTYRWLLALAALAYTTVSLLLRGPAPRHSEQLVNAAGLAILVIAFTGLTGGVFSLLSPFGLVESAQLPDLWELAVLVAGCGLVAYGAVDRAPGPAYLGVLNLLAFVTAAGFSDDPTLLYWPLIVLVLGLAAMVSGLRPRSPLPPEPDAYPRGTVPLAARTDEETVVRVRDDSPPRP